MEAIEKDNATLKGILPKVYARPNLDKSSLGGLIDLIGNIALGDEAAKAKRHSRKGVRVFPGRVCSGGRQERRAVLHAEINRETVGGNDRAVQRACL